MIPLLIGCDSRDDDCPRVNAPRRGWYYVESVDAQYSFNERVPRFRLGHPVLRPLPRNTGGTLSRRRVGMTQRFEFIPKKGAGIQALEIRLGRGLDHAKVDIMTVHGYGDERMLQYHRRTDSDTIRAQWQGQPNCIRVIIHSHLRRRPHALWFRASRREIARKAYRFRDPSVLYFFAAGPGPLKLCPGLEGGYQRPLRVGLRGYVPRGLEITTPERKPGTFSSTEARRLALMGFSGAAVIGALVLARRLTG